MNTTNEQIDIYRSLFCTGRTDAYGSYHLDTYRYYVRNEPVIDEVIRKHLEGRLPFGVYPVRGEVTRIAVADFDKDDAMCRRSRAALL